MWLKLVTDVEFAAAEFVVAVYPATFPAAITQPEKRD